MTNKEKVISYIINNNTKKLKKLLSGILEVHPDFINTKFERGRTFLHVATILKRVNIVELLLRFGAEYDIQDKYKKTAYDIACEYEDTMLLGTYLKFYLNNPLKSGDDGKIAICGKLRKSA